MAGAARAHTALGLWKPCTMHAPPALNVNQATHAVQGLSASNTQHSKFFMPFLHAALDVPDNNIDNVREFVGVQAWDSARERTSSVFAAAGITRQTLAWETGMYLQDHVQLTLLNLELTLLKSGESWPMRAGEDPPSELTLTGGALLMNSVGARVAEARTLLNP